MTSYTTAALFGGALSADIPAHFGDVSNLRQVPDNQEVYVDNEGFSSITFDILERVDKPDDDALNFHLEDIVEDDEEGTTRVLETQTLDMGRLGSNITAYTLFAVHQNAPGSAGKSPRPPYTFIMLVLVRLLEQATDVVVSINVPDLVGEYSPGDGAGLANPDHRPRLLAQDQPSAMIPRAMGWREQIVRTLQIRDWGLFVQE